MKVKKSKKPPKTGEVWPLTVYLLKPGIKTFRDALHKNSRSTPLQPVSELGAVALKAAAPRAPNWASRLATLVPAAAALQQQSPGAVLFIESGRRRFALTFGYGRGLLAPEALEHDFGIKTVLNSVDAGRIRSVDSRTLEASPQSMRKQFIDERPLAAFSLDRMHDLLKGATGRVKAGVTEFEGGLVAGTEALHCRVRIASPMELRECCDAFLKRYRKKDYRADFAFVDHVHYVKDPKDLQKLDRTLLALAKSEPGSFAFGPPRVLAGEQLSRLRCSWDRRRLQGEVGARKVGARIAHLAAVAPDADKFIERLKHDRIELLDAADEAIDSWSLYRGLLIEVRNGKTHILTSGDWYEVRNDFVEQVEERFDEMVKASVTSLALSLPAQTAGQETEADYNKDAAAALGMEPLDKQSFMQGLGTAVEPCDMLDAQRGIFVHVKVGRASATLSHLFNQGLVSTLTFLDERRARDNLRALLSSKGKKAKVLAEPIKAEKLSTVFAVIDKAPAGGKPWRLPFFSMLVASSVSERILRRGVQPFTVRVDAA